MADQKLDITNMNGMTENADQTCAITDMNCVEGQEPASSSITNMNSVTDDADKSCSITDMNCVAGS